jgi:hypothetical protein
MAAQKAVSDSLMSKTKTWMNACLNCEFTRRILDTNGIFNTSMDTVRVGELREVKQHCLNVKKDIAKKARENYDDLMGTVGTRISDEQEEAMLKNLALPTASTLSLPTVFRVLMAAGKMSILNNAGAHGLFCLSRQLDLGVCGLIWGCLMMERPTFMAILSTLE